MIKHVILGRRGTGRSYQALLMAYEEAEKGKHVLFVVHSSEQVHHVRRMLQRATKKPYSILNINIAFVHMGGLKLVVKPFDTYIIDAETMDNVDIATKVLNSSIGDFDWDCVTIQMKDSDVYLANEVVCDSKLKDKLVVHTCKFCSHEFRVSNVALGIAPIVCPSCKRYA